MRFAFTLLAAAILLASPARAALSWAQKTVNLKADPNSTDLEARFKFTNAGDKPVDIRQVESSCGCTTTELERRHYAPGESGEIVAHFKIGAYVGKQVKTIAVKTNDLPQPVTLTLMVDIPEIVRIRPSFVYWMQGEAQRAKTMTLEVDPAYTIDRVTVQSSNPSMSPVLKEVEKGRRYELTVSPSQTDKVLFSMMTVDCNFGDKGSKSFRAYATVKPPENP